MHLSATLRHRTGMGAGRVFFGESYYLQRLRVDAFDRWLWLVANTVSSVIDGCGWWRILSESENVSVDMSLNIGSLFSAEQGVHCSVYSFSSAVIIQGVFLDVFYWRGGRI
jgi:hypothetical protein